MALVSACIIARDEAGSIERCIASASGVADEVVVYDTGSLDATTDIARAAGALVVAGTWPGGFAEARNAALACCRGEWILSLDADEELRCADPAQLRALLRSAPPEVLALQLAIDNVTGVGLGSGYAHVGDRLYRAGRCRWRGRLHEQLVLAGSDRLVTTRRLGQARIVHHGYLEEAVRSSDKLERNLALAQAEVEDPSFGDRGLALVMLGRALWALDRPEEALGALVEGAHGTWHATARRQGLSSAVRILLRLDRPGEALALIGELRAASSRAALADVLEAGAHLALDRPQAALALLEPFTTTTTDDDGYEIAPHTVAEWRAAALVRTGRPAQAADLILGLLRRRGALDVDLGLLVEALGQAGRDLGELASAVPASRLEAVVAAALRLAPSQADAVLDALWHRVAPSGEGDHRADLGEPEPAAVAVLVGGALLGRYLAPELACRWSVRLRRHGLGALCPLAALAGDASAPPRRRVGAALVAASRLGDHSILEGMDRVVVALEAPQRQRGTGDPGTGDPGTGEPGTGEPGAGSVALSLIVSAHGGSPQVLGCVQALARSLPATVAFDVVVVDPGSQDATASVLAGLGGDVTVLRVDAPVSRAQAFHLGAAQAQGEVLVFVDSAARPGPGWLEPLLDALAGDPAVGAVIPAVTTLEGTALAAGWSVRLIDAEAGPSGGLARQPWRIPGLGRPVLESRLDPSSVTAMSSVVDAVGLVLAVRRAAYEAVGGFDPGYWNGGEDLDLCWSLRHAGWQVTCETRSVVATADPDACRSPAAPWAPTDPRRQPFAEAAGLYWQWTDNQARFVGRWGSQLDAG